MFTTSTDQFAGVECVGSSFGSSLPLGLLHDLAVLSLVEDGHAGPDLLLEDPLGLDFLSLGLVVLQVIVIPG